MMRVKVCGITNVSDALMSIQHGAWALGFNFYEKSPRYVSKKSAQSIIENLPSFIVGEVVKIGLFIDETYDSISQYIDDLGLDFVQLYAPLKADKAFNERVILSLQVASEKDLPDASVLNEYGYLLLDAPQASDGLMGGTGRIANWDLATKLARDYRLFLAGGLTADNVSEAIHRVKPYAIDVVSGVERAHGLKDETRTKHFFEECRDDN
ncbi:MAG: hypothetical protein A3J38_09640 [Gammaproteobacteria bacterium RIFCSPHIGHO2_12_FULL_45_9]|nr:MAG: hypothetical protein A3J38_09640 [Gammaproteobacteria bacterium RIFCSPHIGHO2_12_FULL_45_9]